MERWRTETHTFRLPHGESIVTLEDMTLQLDLLIDGEPITIVSSGDLLPLRQQLLGSLPPSNVIKEKTIKLSWLNNNFRQLPDGATDDVISQHAQTHILSMIGSLIMLDTSTRKVHLTYLLLLVDFNMS